jgi:hypothetical protein
MLTRTRSALDVHTYLGNPGPYEREIERLHERYLFTRRLYELQQGGVSLASVSQNKARLARLMSRTVARGEYQLEPACVKRIVVDGKERLVYALRLTDLIVQGVVAGLIEKAMAPLLSNRLFSYRKGISWLAAVSDCARTVRRHRSSHPDPRTRGLYVLRRDIDSYTDSIPVGSRSCVWQMLRTVLVPNGRASSIQPTDWTLIENVVRQEAFVKQGSTFSLFRGVPTGQAISCVLFNLYLMEFDRELAAIPDSFYARYSDDIIFAHPSPTIAQETAARIEARLNTLDLQANADKSRDFYLTGAGRRSSEWPDTRPTTSVPFLGCRVSAAGTVSLSRNKTRIFLREVEARAIRTAQALGGRPQTTVGRAVCAVVNRMTNPGTEDFQQRSAALLRRAVTDRHQLSQLDHWLARIVLGAVAGQRDVRAFRQVAYRTIRRSWGLHSMLHARNRWPRTTSS